MSTDLIYSKENKVFSDEWNQILDEIASFRRKSVAKWIWFRGHSSETYKLDSGLFRIMDGNKKKLPIEKYLEIESHLFINFKNQSSTFIREDLIDLHFHMQHHGLKTRLLDWTESFVTALYFAFEGWDYNNGENACIWLLDPFALNHFVHGEEVVFTADNFKIDYNYENLPKIFAEDIELRDEKETFKKHSFAIYPDKNNPRLLSQNGYFTVQSNSLEDLEAELNDICPQSKEKILKKIILSPSLLDNVYEYLTINGINRFTVYNDADGLSAYLNKELTENLFDPKLKNITKFRG
ncbi:FRG domain-containing protein [Bacillus cereus]|nr:FRG domain-containing protein [Bacillus cereus]